MPVSLQVRALFHLLPTPGENIPIHFIAAFGIMRPSRSAKPMPPSALAIASSCTHLDIQQQYEEDRNYAE